MFQRRWLRDSMESCRRKCPNSLFSTCFERDEALQHIMRLWKNAAIFYRSVERIEKVERRHCGNVLFSLRCDTVVQTAQTGVLASLFVSNETLESCVKRIWRASILFCGVHFGHWAMSSWLIAFSSGKGRSSESTVHYCGPKTLRAGRRQRKFC